MKLEKPVRAITFSLSCYAQEVLPLEREHAAADGDIVSESDDENIDDYLGLFLQSERVS